nr:hypothetical protein CFP56_66207 [Quercus suber]
MLQRLGMVIAISGLIPELLAVLESMTAHRQAGVWPMIFTCWQQLSGTAAFTSCAAVAQGASFIASLSGVDFPHALAPSTFSRPAMLTSTSKPRRQMNFIGAAIPAIYLTMYKFSAISQCWNPFLRDRFYTAI